MPTLPSTYLQQVAQWCLVSRDEPRNLSGPLRKPGALRDPWVEITVVDYIVKGELRKCFLLTSHYIHNKIEVQRLIRKPKIIQLVKDSCGTVTQVF